MKMMKPNLLCNRTSFHLVVLLSSGSSFATILACFASKQLCQTLDLKLVIGCLLWAYIWLFAIVLCTVVSFCDASSFLNESI
jgi:ABC-type transport system involved in Fe-S cluster assembly fused permease/ATPase subunit